MGRERSLGTVRVITDQKRAEKVSARIVLFALVLVALFASLTPYNDYYLANNFIAGNLLPTSSMVILILWTFLLNPFLRRITPSFALKGSELAALWALLVVPSGIPAAGLWRYIIPQIANLYYRASPENRWDESLLPHTPKWMVVADRVAAKGFYEGTEGRILWEAWLVPLSFWLAFGFALFFATFCLATLIRRQWMEREQFTFPLVQLPYELVRDPSPGGVFPPILSSLPLWLGFSASASLHLLCGLNTYFPAIPAIRRFRHLGEYLTGFPWNAITWTGLHIYPVAIGLTYLLTSEVALSLWSFYVLERLQQILFAYYGLTAQGFSAADFVQFQQVGAILGLLVIIVYAARTHWKEVFFASLPGRPRKREMDDRDEPLPLPLAFWGFLATTFILLLTLLALGMNPLLAVTFLVMTYGFYFAVSWIATNGGMVMVQMRILPFDPLIALFGTRRFPPRSIVMMCLLQEAFAYDLRETLMPSLLNAMKMGQLAGLRLRPLMIGGFLGIIVAAFLSLHAWLKLGYTFGAVTLTKTATFSWHANYPFNLAIQYIDPGMEPNTFRVIGLCVGFIGFITLYLLRLRFLWFPLHPVGWIVCRGWAIEQFWLMILTGWGVKGLIVRYGGLTGYRALRPFFLGIVLGDLTMAGIFTVIGFLTGKGYPVMPL